MALPDGLSGGDVAVVGANGFIGRHLVHELTTRGTRVSGWTRQQPAVVHGVVAPLVARARTVVLVAGSVNPAIAQRDPDAVQSELAELGSLVGALARSAVDRSTSQRVVFASSGGTVYDASHPPPYAEDDPVGPTTAYGRLKLAVEQTLGRHAGVIEPVVLRLANVYGPGQRLGTGQGVIGHWLHAAAAGRPLEVYGDAATSRDYVYVADVAAAVEAVHRSGTPPSVINIGSGTATSLGELGRLVSQAVGRDDVDLKVVPARAFDRQDVFLDIRLARTTLGWVPATSLRAGLAATWSAVSTARVGDLRWD
jgi:UDP-glucose 4-epimerase